MSIALRFFPLAITALVVASPGMVRADITPLFTESLSEWPVPPSDFGDGSTYGVSLVSPTTPFNDGNAVRVYDYSTVDKPEMVRDLGSPLQSPFRIDFQSINQNFVSGSANAIRFRMLNSGGASIGTEANVAFSLSWQADGRFTAKYSDLGLDGNLNDVDTLNSLALTGAKSITMVANGAMAGSYTYTLFGQTRSLNALAYDVYVDRVLLNTAWANGLAFHTGFSTGYTPSAGLGRLGLIGNGNSNVDPDYLFDNIILRTGDDIAPIPEPSCFALLGLSGLFLALRRR